MSSPGRPKSYSNKEISYYSVEELTELLSKKADLVDGKVPLEQLDTKETGELLVGTSTNYDTSRDDQIPTTKAVDAMVNELKNSVDNKLTKKADLDESGKVPASQLPGYVDDVIEVDNFGDLPIEGESGKVYIVKSTNITYRWSGTQYTVIGKDLALGETSSTAFPGDRGRALELNTVKKTTEDAQNTPLYQIKQLYGNIVSARFSDKYVLLVFGTTIENNACSLTIYDSGSIKQFNSIWLNYTLGQVLNMGPDYENSYSNVEIDELISASPMSTYEVDLTEASWVRLAKVKDLTKNSSGQFIFDCYGRKVNEKGTVIDTLENYSAKRNYQYRFEMHANAQSLFELMEQGVQFEIYYNCNDVNGNELILNSGDYEGIYRNLYGMTKYIGAGNIFGDTDYSTGVFTSNTIMHYGFPLQDRLIGVPAYKISVTAYNNAHNRFVPLYSLYKNGELLYTNTTFVNPDEMLGDDVTYSIPVDSLEQTDIIVIDFSAHNGLYNGTENEIVELRVSPYFDLNRITLSMTGALSGLEGVITYIQTPFPVNKITELGSHQEILTTSVFNVTCGLDDNGNLITDVLPITQSPELSGTDSSGGGSGGGDTGSGGSGLTGTHGLASILLENYEGETYVCGLINFPNTGNYLGTYIEMKIENNLNFETLNILEVVDIEEKVNNGEFQLLEGTKFENDLRYDFTIRTTVQNLINSISILGRFEFKLYDSNKSDYTVCFVQSGSPMTIGGVASNIVPNETGRAIIPMYGRFVKTEDPKVYLWGTEDYFNGEEKSLYDLLDHWGCTTMDDAKVDESHILSVNLPSLSGTLYICPNDRSSEETYVKVTYNGVVTEYNFERDPDNNLLNDIAISLEHITKDNSYITIESNNAATSLLGFEPSDAVIEYTITGFNPPKDFEFKSYSVSVDTLDASVFGNNYYKFHKTSDSYDLFSVYNKLDKIEEDIAKIGNNINILEEKNISENINVTYNEGLGKFPAVSATVNYLMSNASHSGAFQNTTRRHFGVMFRGMLHDCDLLGSVHPTDGVSFRNNWLLTEDAEIILDGNITAENYINLIINCKTLEVQGINKIKEILRDVMYNSSLIWHPMFVENNYFAIGYNRNTIVTTDNSCADDIRGTYIVSFNYEYIDDSEGNRFTAQVSDITRNRKYLWSIRLNKDTYNYETLHAWLYSNDFPEYTSLESGGGSIDTYTKNEIDDKLGNIDAILDNLNGEVI